MADDRSLKDVIRFVDPSGDMTDADIAAISSKLKFTEVLDIITYVGNDNLSKAREILSKYDSRFSSATEESITNEYSNVPTANRPSGFKPIKPIGSTPSIAGKPTNPNGQQSDDEDADDLLNDPANQNRPEVKQIQSLLQRMKR
jgi:hypothetical protein